jgi:hypothetical protein
MKVRSRDTIVSDLSDLMETISTKCPKTKFDNDLKLIFESKVLSYREVLLLIFVAKSINPTYNPNKDFYSCSPRTMAEGPLNDFFMKYRIPHTKSGPLNILKAHTINEEWVKQRDGKDAANSILKIAKYISESVPSDFDTIAESILWRFKEISAKVESVKIEVPPCSDIIGIYNCLKTMIDEATDGGNTPQRIVSMILDSYYASLGVPNRIEGGLDSAYTTNTTSKKPGDIVEIDSTFKCICKVYEITVKRFDQKRLLDSLDSIRVYDNGSIPINEVVVLCREQDVQVGQRISGPCIGTVTEGGVTYIFQDIYNWIFVKLLSMTDDSRKEFFQKFGEYIQSYNTPMKVKEKWIESVECFIDKKI